MLDIGYSQSVIEELSSVGFRNVEWMAVLAAFFVIAALVLVVAFDVLALGEGTLLIGAGLVCAILSLRTRT